MHPMFVKLFLETDADDVLAEEDKRRREPGQAHPIAHGHQAHRSRPGSQTVTVNSARGRG